jgi:hypothetical protein
MTHHMDPSVERARRQRAEAAGRAHVVLALACLPFVAGGAGGLAALAHVAPSMLGAAGLAAAVLSGPLAAGALRWSTARAPEPAAVPVASAAPPEPALSPRERWARELMAWRETPFRRSTR